MAARARAHASARPLTSSALASTSGSSSRAFNSPSASTAGASASGQQANASLISHYAQLPARTITYQDLTRFGGAPLSDERVLESARHSRDYILRGLARRVTAHASLPYLPATNPSLHKIYSLYLDAFNQLAAVPEPKTVADNEQLCRVMENMVAQHSDNVPTLARGFQESRKYLPDSFITNFLDRGIRNRISLRLAAEQHISLTDPLHAESESFAADQRPGDSDDGGYIGIVAQGLRPARVVERVASFVRTLCESTYGVAPKVVLKGGEENLAARVGLVPVHLEYILTELLKNAARASVERAINRDAEPPKKNERNPLFEGPGEDEPFRIEEPPGAHLISDDIPPVEVTIGRDDGLLSIRIRDRGGGIAPENLPNVFSYSFTTVPLMRDPDQDPDSPSAPDIQPIAGASMDDGPFGRPAWAAHDQRQEQQQKQLEDDNDATGYYTASVGGPPGAGPDGASSLRSSEGTLAGLGYGLPLSRLYANYFGGSLELMSVDGWGTDLYVVLRTL